MSIYSQASKADKRRIRREMLKQAEDLVKATGAKDWKFLARQIVDSAIAKERHEHIESSDSESVTVN